MKNLCLENLNVNQLSVQEIKNIGGGDWRGILVAVVLWVAAEWDYIKAGYQDGINGNPYNYDPCD